MQKFTDSELIRRAQKQDSGAVSALYQKYHQDIFRFLYYLTGEQEAAEDLTSEVFLRLMRFLPEYRLMQAPFKAWLFRVAKNLSTDYFRSKQRRSQEALHEEIHSGQDSPERVTEHTLLNDRLHSALEGLSETQKNVIILRFLVGLPISDVARAINRSENAVKGLQRRALMTLRETLGDLEVLDE